ncbi:MAG: HAD family hydrolase [Rickettsiales bacterium]
MLVLLDRDGVLNEELPNGILSLDDLEIYAYVPSALGMLRKAGFKIAVVTNQSAIGKGTLTEETLEIIHHHLQETLLSAGGFIDRFYFAPDHPDKPTHRRKPNPGMLEEALADFAAKPADTPLVGDSLRDLEAAAALGCPRILVKTGNGLKTIEAGIPSHVHPVVIVRDMEEAARYILSRFS